jgi:hypothetical protein
MNSVMSETNRHAARIRLEYESDLRDIAKKKEENAKGIAILKRQYLANSDVIIEREHLQQGFSNIEEKIRVELKAIQLVETPVEDLTQEQIEALRKDFG